GDPLPSVFPTPGPEGQTDPDRHTRVRRWDQAGTVRNAAGDVIVDLDQPASTGEIPIPASGGPVVLEHGVQVSFDADPAGGALKAGDFWMFAARSADSSLEALDREPPRGPHHHYGRLAVVTFPDAADDCRALWPPE